ncbi:hypothetical protein HPB47_014373 [Ixodes persulcatus]|uniref:Uncharacterized protein n=1 Tax=Ixodes persulcatus TaxID=34615 RepID=A0AC60QWF6_IXOPE|nr:hypothetical protein HPB47_014373 [Ixodes persulcatus]
MVAPVLRLAKIESFRELFLHSSEQLRVERLRERRKRDRAIGHQILLVVTFAGQIKNDRYTAYPPSPPKKKNKNTFTVSSLSFFFFFCAAKINDALPNDHSEPDAKVSELTRLCPEDEKIRETVAKIQNHVAVIQQSTDRVSSQAEVYGAVQQEERMSRAFEVMVTHVENLKRVSEKEHRELEEARKLLLDHQLQEVAAGSPPTKDSRGRLFSVPNSNLVAGPVRALRSLGASARRCSLPMAQALASSDEAHSLFRDVVKHGHRDTCDRLLLLRRKPFTTRSSSANLEFCFRTQAEIDR